MIRFRLAGLSHVGLCSGSSERGGVGHHYEAAAADPTGSRPGDPGGRGPKYGQVSPFFSLDLPEDTRCQNIWRSK